MRSLSSIIRDLEIIFTLTPFVKSLLATIIKRQGRRQRKETTGLCADRDSIPGVVLSLRHHNNSPRSAVTGAIYGSGICDIVQLSVAIFCTVKGNAVLSTHSFVVLGLLNSCRYELWPHKQE